MPERGGGGGGAGRNCPILRKLGLEEPVFIHWHGFVAVSRVGIPSHLHVTISRSCDKKIRNIVLLDIFNN